MSIGSVMDMITLSAAIQSVAGSLKGHMEAMSSVVEEKKNGGGEGAAAEAAARGRSASIVSMSPPKPADKVRVIVRVALQKVGTIETIRDRYTADVLIQSKWKEPRLDGQKLSSSAIKWADYWNPMMTIQNVLAGSKVTVTNSVTYNGSGQATVHESKKVSGTFFQFLLLHKFPFDRQDLSVLVTSDWESNLVDFEEDNINPSVINTAGFGAAQEWRLSRTLRTMTKTIDKSVNNVKKTFPLYSAIGSARRRPDYFFWNIILIMFLIGALAFATFSISLEIPQNRITVSFMLLLTSVTFKFAVSKSLPKIAYLTYMDKYILGSMLIIISIIVWHAIVGALIYPNLPKIGNIITTVVKKPTLTTMKATTTMRTTTAGNLVNSTNVPNCTAAASSTPSPAGDLCLLADRMTLGLFGAIYVALHLVFLCLVSAERRKDDNEYDTSSIKKD